MVLVSVFQSLVGFRIHRTESVLDSKAQCPGFTKGKISQIPESIESAEQIDKSICNGNINCILLQTNEVYSVIITKAFTVLVISVSFKNMSS